MAESASDPQETDKVLHLIVLRTLGFWTGGLVKQVWTEEELLEAYSKLAIQEAQHSYDTVMKDFPV